MKNIMSSVKKLYNQLLIVQLMVNIVPGCTDDNMSLFQGDDIYRA